MAVRQWRCEWPWDLDRDHEGESDAPSPFHLLPRHYEMSVSHLGIRMHGLLATSVTVL